MMVFPEITVTASKKAIGIWLDSVVPSLLPFMMFSGIIKNTGARHMAGRKLFPVFMAFLSGYPMGAKLAGEQYREGLIHQKGLEQLLCYAMITGPAFLIGGIGVTIYGDKLTGYILAWSHYAGALTCGMLLGKGDVIALQVDIRREPAAAAPSDTPFTDCMLESFKTLGIVLSYIILFMILTDFITGTGSFAGMPGEMAAFCKGLLEMTVGCSEIAACSGPMRTKLLLSSFVISFGGLSVIGQTMSVLAGCPVRLWQILRIKFFHGICSGIWTFIICAFVL